MELASRPRGLVALEVLPRVLSLQVLLDQTPLQEVEVVAAVVVAVAHHMLLLLVMVVVLLLLLPFLPVLAAMVPLAVGVVLAHPLLRLPLQLPFLLSPPALVVLLRLLLPLLSHSVINRPKSAKAEAVKTIPSGFRVTSGLCTAPRCSMPERKKGRLSPQEKILLRNFVWMIECW